MSDIHLLPLLIIAAVAVVILVAILLIRKKRTTGGGASQDDAESGSQVYLGNLSYRVNEGDIRNFFSKYGEIRYIKVVRNPQTRRSKGYAFITFNEVEDAQKALSAHGMQFEERALVVKIAKPRSES